MKNGARYVVETHWGVFSLDEGAYRDYLAGKLWITWMPGGKGSDTRKPAEERLPAHISPEAEALEEQAKREGLFAVLNRLGGEEEIPFAGRLADVSIDEMNLSVRSSNGLKRAGADTFGKVRELLFRENGLRSVRNLGEKSEKEIRRLFFEECYSKMTLVERALYWQKVLDGRKSEC